MTRRLPLTLAALLASLFCVFALALPAAATEGAEETTAEAETDWTGVVLAIGAGFVVAGLMFADASPGSIPRADAHH